MLVKSTRGNLSASGRNCKVGRNKGSYKLKKTKTKNNKKKQQFIGNSIEYFRFEC